MLLGADPKDRRTFLSGCLPYNKLHGLSEGGTFQRGLRTSVGTRIQTRRDDSLREGGRTAGIERRLGPVVLG